MASSRVGPQGGSALAQALGGAGEIAWSQLHGYNCTGPAWGRTGLVYGSEEPRLQLVKVLPRHKPPIHIAPEDSIMAATVLLLQETSHSCIIFFGFPALRQQLHGLGVSCELMTI
eukprot:scaffold178033_cov15-Tisochrysis_lutea.AAC.1